MADDTATTASDYEARRARQDAADYIIKINSFDGGLVDSMNADIIKNSECVEANGVSFDNHILNLAKGSQYYGNAPTSGSFISLYFHTQY